MLLEKVKIASINPGMANVELAGLSELNHVESVAMMYSRITWHYKDGNIRFRRLGGAITAMALQGKCVVDDERRFRGMTPIAIEAVVRR